MHRVSLATLCLVLTTFVTGCQRDKEFKTHAVYRAPANQYVVTIDAQGVVLAGHDTSDDGVGTVRLVSTDASNPFHITLNVDHSTGRVSYRIEGGEVGELPWGSKSSAGSIEDVLKLAGATIQSSAEITDTAYVIEAALDGPKRTILPGQAKVLDVEEARFE